MRAITGAVISSKPCSIAKAGIILCRFYDSAASYLPSADCATYLLTAADATQDLKVFRRGLRANQQQGAANLEVHDYYEGDIKHQDRERKGGMAVPTRGSHRDSCAEVEIDVAAAEKKSKKKNQEDRQEGRAVAGIESHIPSSTGITGQKRKKEKHSIQEIIVNVKQEPDLVADEELASEKKSKKKKEKHRVKLEEEVRDVNLGLKIVNDDRLGQNVAGGEKKRKKKKHEEEEVYSKNVKQEKMSSDGDLDSEKKRKKKRGRGDNNDNALEQVEQTKKKQRK
ncbi:hypothetical protein BAE44_0023848 [Dichanthelium oligosanthes]|uniref:Uncharacterized protein n=1 Tax=Dichanthelium oligosanthes TaxID=888268 RepID=A0A1E5UQF4_9POAL|nr:hypothetical protein BAE44_0023848 [Dichanthelium oligosanthes]